MLGLAAFEYADEATARRCGDVTAAKEALKRQVAAASADVDDTNDDGDLPPLKPDVDDNDEVDRLVSPLVQALMDATPSPAAADDPLVAAFDAAEPPGKRVRQPPALERSGIGSAAYATRLVRSLDRCGDVTKKVPLRRFMSAILEPVDVGDGGTSGPLAPAHEELFLPSSSRLTNARVVVDADGAPIQWPWETSTYLTGGIGVGSSMSRPVRAWHPLDVSVNAGLDQASRDGKRGRTHTGVKAWFAFCEDTMGTQADRPMDPNEPLWAKLEEEWLAMRFVCALVEERGISTDSARVYFSSLQGWHAREHGVKLAGGLKLERLPQMLKGLRRIIGDQPRAVRRGIAPQALKKAFDLVLDPSNPVHANIRAALATALQGLLRSAEFTSSDKRDMLTRDDLVQLNDDQMVIMMHPCKNMHHLSGKTCPLVIGAGGEFVDAVWEVANLLRIDPTPPGLEGTTPLFRDPSTNAPLSYQLVLDVTRQLMRAIGEDESQFGTHSYRIGGATALFAAGANETVIRTMGRWSSDLHRLYVRACFEQCVDWTRRAGSTQVSDLSGTFDEVDYY